MTKISAMLLLVLLGATAMNAVIEGFLTGVENQRVVVAWSVDSNSNEILYYADAVGKRGAAFFDVYPGMVREVSLLDGTWVTTAVGWDEPGYSSNAYFSRYNSADDFVSYVSGFGIVWTAAELYNELPTVVPTISSAYSSTQINPVKKTTWTSGTFQWP